MDKIKLNTSELKRWFQDRGDYTHNITYDLNEDSVVMDLGGFTGLWAKQIISKYNPNIYIIEPVYEFYNDMVKIFEDNDKVHILNVAVGTENKNSTIYLNGDATSTNLNTGISISVRCNTIEKLLEEFKVDSVDLIQINIEGDEYSLLEDMLKTGIVNKFKNIQIQFHKGIDNDIERRDNIRSGLSNNGFVEKFNYPFVWESWGKNK
jgi:FkbM family methyltransferase